MTKNTEISGARKRAEKSAKNDTYEQILEKSRVLFNTFGAESVSINHIAETLGISAGNLTYHFKRKRDIVVALLEDLNHDFTYAVEHFPLTGEAAEFVASYASLFKLIWRYRFLFNTTSYLLNQELMTGDEYQGLIDDVKAVFLRQTTTLVEQGYMSPVAEPYAMDTLIDCMWWLWVGWLKHANVRMLADDQLQEKPVIDGIRHFLFITQPYINKKYFRSILKEVDALETKIVAAVP